MTLRHFEHLPPFPFILKHALLPAPDLVNVVDFLHAEGADVNAVDEHGNTALMYAVVKRRCVATISALVLAGADVNHLDTCGFAAIHRAAMDGDDRILKVLVSAPGCHVDVLSRCGSTPLHWACMEWSTESVRVLLRAGANVRARTRNTSDPVTPLCVALRSPRPRGVKQCARVVNVLLDAGARINVKTGEDMMAPLHRAVVGGLVDVTVLLLRRGADMHACDGYGSTPFQLAQHMGHDSLVKAFEKHADRCMHSLLREEEAAEEARKPTASCSSAFRSAVLMEARGENYGLRLLVLSMHPLFAPRLGPLVKGWVKSTRKKDPSRMSAEDAFALPMLKSL